MAMISSVTDVMNVSVKKKKFTLLCFLWGEVFSWTFWLFPLCLFIELLGDCYHAIFYYSRWICCGLNRLLHDG